MNAVTRISVPVATRSPTGRTNAYLVGTEGAVLVDPAARTAELDEAVADRRVDHVLVTHAHADHVGAVAHYAEACDATVWARAGRVDRFRRATGVEPDRTFAEGTRIGPTTVIETPGHAPDHVALAADPDGRGLLVGDLAVASGSVFVGATEGDMRAYLTSLRRLHARDPERLYPGHGPVVTDARGALARLVGHRLAREERVREAIEAGATTLDEVLDAAYDKDLTDVRDLARETVAAHVAKLAVEGVEGVEGVPTRDDDGATAR